jgi:hypothetical protein
MRKAEMEHKFDEIVAFAEIERFIDTPVKYYSSGMHVRLAFAVAAHLEPEILLVDEVLAVGDAAFQKKCLGLWRREEKGMRHADRRCGKPLQGQTGWSCAAFNNPLKKLSSASSKGSSRSQSCSLAPTLMGNQLREAILTC